MSQSPSDLGLILSAAHFSADKHRDQRRKGGRNTPYINHPLEVAERLNRVGGIEDATILAAAILHDTIEDTQTTEREIVRVFGPAVAAIVAELTDDPYASREERKRREIAKAPHLSEAAKLIKLADKACNVTDTVANPPSDWTLQRRRDYLDFAEQVAAGCSGINGALDADFSRALAEARHRLR